MKIKASIPQSNSSYNIGLNFLGPLTKFFLDSLKIQCQQIGITKIFFLSRDGQTPFKCFNIETQKIQSTYIYVSRQTLHLPSITQLDEYTYSWLFDDEILDIFKILRKLNISKDEVIIPNNFKFEITAKNIIELKTWLCSPEISKLVLKKSELARNKLIAYLLQEGFFTEKKIAIVDIGWHGRLQTSLTKIAKTENPNIEIHGFYFGLFQYPDKIEKTFLHPILFSPETPRNRFKRNAEVYEVLMSATHETTIDYSADENGKTTPILLSEMSENQKEIIEGIQRGCIQYCIDSSDKIITQKETIKAMSNLFSFPSSRNVEVIKSVLFSSSQGASSDSSLLRNLSKTEILLSLVGRKAISRKIWLEAEIVSAFPPIISYSLLLHLYLSRIIRQLTSS